MTGEVDFRGVVLDQGKKGFSSDAGGAWTLC